MKSSSLLLCIGVTFACLELCSAQDVAGDLVTSQHLNTKSGKFWQITDIHWDPNYSPVGNKYKMCHVDDINGHFNGYMGQHLCDAPWLLVQSAIKAMQLIEPNPDFILWTGNSVSHSNVGHNMEEIMFVLSSITYQLKEHFGPKVKIIPALGNLDSPMSTYPAGNTSFYNRYLEEANWRILLDKTSASEFKQGGFYSTTLPSGLTVLTVNTNLYNPMNKLASSSPDPAGQLHWLRYKLSLARQQHTKVIIASHTPPGVSDTNVCFLNKTFNEKYVKMLNEYGDVILTQVYGHVHKDSFRVFSGQKGVHRSVGFIAPAVSPMWSSGPAFRTPSVRLYEYNDTCLLDYVQYRVNLTETNNHNEVVEPCLTSAKAVHCGELMAPFWRLFYRATQTFGVGQLDAASMYEVHSKLRANPQAFQRYYNIHSASFNTIPCNQRCVRAHLCAITNLLVDQFSACFPSAQHAPALAATPSLLDDDARKSKVVAAVIIVATLLVISLVVVFTVLIHRGANLNPSYPDHYNGDARGYAPLLPESDDFDLSERTI